MTRRRWIADEVSGNHAALRGEHARHLAQVLRVQVGQEFDVATGAEVRLGRVINIQPDRVDFELGELIAATAQTPITVAISIFKFDRMEWAIEKCTELGVVKIIPVIAGRTEPHLAKATGKRVERWRRLVRQASEQSRRAVPPEITDPIKLDTLVGTTAGTRIILSEVEQATSLKNAVPPDATEVLLAFGPEGGWKEQELAAFEKNGWVSASLGPTILRTETAVIAAVAISQSLLQVFERDAGN